VKILVVPTNEELVIARTPGTWWESAEGEGEALIGLPWPSSWEALRIDVPALKADGEPLEDAFSLPVPLLSHWGLDYRFPQPVAFRVRASRQGERILVEVGMKGVLVVPCSRCLAPASASMEGEGEFAFRLGPEGRQESEDEDGGDTPQEDVQELDAWADRVEAGASVLGGSGDRAPFGSALQRGLSGALRRIVARTGTFSPASVRRVPWIQGWKRFGGPWTQTRNSSEGRGNEWPHRNGVYPTPGPTTARLHWLGALEAPAMTTCSHCGETIQTYRACPACGYYRGRQVLAGKEEASAKKDQGAN
jgi:ribosomal protein L32